MCFGADACGSVVFTVDARITQAWRSFTDSVSRISGDVHGILAGVSEILDISWCKWDISWFKWDIGWCNWDISWYNWDISWCKFLHQLV